MCLNLVRLRRFAYNKDAFPPPLFPLRLLYTTTTTTSIIPIRYLPYPNVRMFFSSSHLSQSFSHYLFPHIISVFLRPVDFYYVALLSTVSLYPSYGPVRLALRTPFPCPVARASEVFLNRFTSGSYCRAAHSPLPPKIRLCLETKICAQLPILKVFFFFNFCEDYFKEIISI